MSGIYNENKLWANVTTPNPAGTASTDLTKLGIDGVNYNVKDADAYHDGDLATVAETGSYSDLSNTPSIPTKTSDLTNDSGFVESSDLATVATSGSYYDLTNKPTIPAAQVNSDWDASSGVAAILHKPALATVATSGSYNDLSNKPTIPTVNNGTLTIQKNGTNVQTFSANQSGNATANIECAVPSDVEGSKVVTGNPITVTDAAGIKAEKIVIEFEPKQAGSGTPSPSNIRPITGYTSISADGCGKNLYDSSKVASQTLPNGNTRSSICFNKLTGTYTISRTTGENCYWGIWDGSSFSSNGNVAVNSSHSITITNNDVLWLWTDSGKNMSGINNLQVEKNPSATTYEPFKGDNVTVQFGQTLYGGKLTILQDGSADVDCDTGFDVYTGENTENWVFSYQNSYYQAARENTTMKNSLDAFTNEFENIALSDRGTKNGFVTYSDTTIRVALLPSFGITSVAQWQTFLASHNLQVAYKLATPFTLHLSPVETITLLQGINNVWTDGTTLSLTYQPDNAIGQAKGTAQDAMAIANGLKPLYSTGSVGSGKTGVQKIAQITLSEVGTYYITGWAKFTGGGKKAVQLWCAGSLGESWENSTIATGEPKTFSTFAIYTSTVANEDVKVNSYTVSASNAVTGGLVAFKIS